MRKVRHWVRLVLARERVVDVDVDVDVEGGCEFGVPPAMASPRGARSDIVTTTFNHCRIL